MRVNAVYIRHRQERHPFGALAVAPSEAHTNGTEAVPCNNTASSEKTGEEESACKVPRLEKTAESACKVPRLEKTAESARKVPRLEKTAESACKVPRLEKTAESACKVPHLEKTAVQPLQTTAAVLGMASIRSTRTIIKEVFNIFRGKVANQNPQSVPVTPSQLSEPLSLPVHKLFLRSQDPKLFPTPSGVLDNKENIPPVDANISTAVSLLEKFRKEAIFKQLSTLPSQTDPGLRLRNASTIQNSMHGKGKAGSSSKHSCTNTSQEGTPNERNKPTKNTTLRRSRRKENTSGNVLVSKKHLSCFFQLVEDPVVRKFLKVDICRRYADKYLLAMVFTYFVRAGLKCHQYSKENFFAALYLAHDMEEDEEELKYEVFPWALGHRWRKTYPSLLRKRDIFWAIDCRAVVSKRCCDQVMEMQPDHWMWERERPIYHGGAHREHLRHPVDNGHPRGPDKSPLQCQKCLERECVDSENSYLLYLSDTDTSIESTCLADGKTVEHKERDSGFETFLCQPSDTSINSPQGSVNHDKMDIPTDRLNDNGQDDTKAANYTGTVQCFTNNCESSSACDVSGNGNVKLSKEDDIEDHEAPVSQADTIFTSQILSQ
ncbi:uncharacterized protein [Cherax quadricarinatus]